MALLEKPVRNLEDALAVCLDDLDAGVTSEECLARFPDYADELRPLLAVAMDARQTASWPTLSLAGRVRGRERMHAALTQRRHGFTFGRLTLTQIAMMALIVATAVGAWLSWPSPVQKKSCAARSMPRPMPKFWSRSNRTCNAYG